MSVDVEQLAVNKITDMVARCPRLTALINTNDKTPVYDGEILLYSSQSKRNETLAGRVRVQVKGIGGRARKSNRKKGSIKSRPSFQIKRTDLESFQRDGGGIYFVVTVGKRSSRRIPYYTLLQPYRIAKLLKDKTSQKSIAVPFDIFPNAGDQIYRIVDLAYKSRRQDMQLEFNISQAHDVAELTFTLHTLEPIDFNAPMILDPLTGNYVLEVHTANGLLPYSGRMDLFPPDYQKQRRDLSLSSGPITYDTAYIQRISGQQFVMEMPGGLKLIHTVTPDETQARVDLVPTGTLAVRLKALEFYQFLIETSTIEIEGHSYPFKITSGQADESFQRHLRALRELSELLERLNVDTNLIRHDELTDKQLDQLNTVYRAFVSGEEIVSSSITASQWLLSIGSWQLRLLITQGSAPDKWKLVDPFAAKTGHYILWRSEDLPETIPVTAYELIPNDMGRVLNANLNAITDAYASIIDSEHTFGLANQSVLALISAADTTPSRATELLAAATRLTSWLIDENGPEVPYLINRWQIASRHGPLTETQRREIRELKYSMGQGTDAFSRQTELACAILLTDEEDVQYLSSRLAESDLAVVRNWPIWNLTGQSMDEAGG